jgi:ribose/xylose/arabinose/galactoside ABC-type transport system permease subunit
MNRKRSFGQLAASFFQRYSLGVLTIVMIAIFAIVNDNFLTFSNFQNVLEQNAALALVAVGITFIIISRMLDLSPGSVIALSGVVLGLAYQASNNIWIALVACMATTILIGVFNGSLIAKVDLNPVIVTLACYIWARGLALALTEKASIVIQNPFVGFMNTRWLGLVSPPMLLILLAYLVGAFLLNRTRLGRYTFAMGADECSHQAGAHRSVQNRNLHLQRHSSWDCFDCHASPHGCFRAKRSLRPGARRDCCSNYRRQ